ncbi:YqaJ viral recombinase family protein [Streptomyces sp. UG1]|uniref:YqaJ viral recombinase family nuclease n=1 Tax=Streptomyces sp. UG1 TaxID=3417652 RepID=UPI003CFBA9BA
MTTRPASTPPATPGGNPAGPEVFPQASGPAETVHAAFPTARLVLPADAPEDQWHAARQLGLGGSDIAAVLGLHRYKGPLHVWEEKQGRGDHTDSEAAECGRELEAVIARLFSRRAGLEIAPAPGTLQHIEHAWMLANLDRLVIERTPALGIPSVVPLECKNRSEYQARDWDDEVPDEPALQLHWYLAVTGYGHGYVAALIGGNRLRWHRIDRDDELIEHLVEYCGDWWQRHVVEGAPPPPDGSKATTQLLAHLWDAKEDATAEVDPVEALLLKQRRRELKEQITSLGEDLDEVENQMKAMLGEAEVALTGGRTAFTWRANGTFAAKRFREAEPKLAAEYTRLAPAVDIERFKADHPEIYRKYRARRLHVPTEG